MRYTFQKIFLVIFTLFFWVLSAVALIPGLGDSPKLYFAAIAVTASLAALIVFTSWRKITRYQTQTYDWYIQRQPNALRNNRVFCHYCNSGKLHTRNLFNKTFTREHFCGQCGKTLYYSPESD